MQEHGNRVAIETLGCKLNQAETEFMARQLIGAGYELVSAGDMADIYILNTCTVTHIADRKARHWLRMAHRRNPDALLVATGCYAQQAPQELAQLDGVELILDNSRKLGILWLLEEAGFSGDGTPGWTGKNGHLFRTRALIKVQKGCATPCTYCIVPAVRGRETSLRPEMIIAEVKSRLAEGYKEVVLTGTKVGAYNRNGVDLAVLIERILAETEVPRLRLSSLQPQEISSELLTLWQDERLCRHFHIALQSGSGSVLQRMKRRYSVQDYKDTVSLIRGIVPDAAITTDVIVGFPGETVEEFQESLDFCHETEFARIHVFPYSPRRGTPAVAMPGQVKDGVKKERTDKMLALAEESARNFRRRFLGRTMTVLWEQRDNGIWSGLTDNYVKVYTESNEDLTNKLTPVKLTELRGDGVCGSSSIMEAGNLWIRKKRL